jgi:hypothetical protein
MKLERYITRLNLNEAAYPNNLGFEELVKFYKVASDAQIRELEKIIEKGDWDEFKDIIKRVLGVALH